MKTQTFWKLGTVFVALAVGGVRADHTRDVNIYSFLTPAGKNLIPPTADHPAFCLLLNGGYHEASALVAGEKSPAPEKVTALVKQALAAAHYLDLQAQKNPQELDYIIVYYWGYMNPQADESDPDRAEAANGTPAADLNGAAMIGLVAGDSINRMIPNTRPWWEAMQAAKENRYFVFIAAYSPAAYIKDNKKERKLLWRAQMSLPSDGLTLDQSIGALVNSSVAYLGRPTDLPKQVTENLDRPSQVIVGTPEIKEYLPVTGSPQPDRAQQK